MSIDLKVNEQITAKQVKLVIEGKMVGVFSTREAITRARTSGLDLVVVSDAAEQPVCRILNVDKYRFERAKEEREMARKRRELTVETKEVQLRPTIGDADLAVKAKRAREFLESGDRVKVVVRFKGREKTHKAEGYRVINHFIAEVGDHKIDKPVQDGESEITVVLGSNVTKSERQKRTN